MTKKKKQKKVKAREWWGLIGANNPYPNPYLYINKGAAICRMRFLSEAWGIPLKYMEIIRLREVLPREQSK